MKYLLYGIVRQDLAGCSLEPGMCVVAGHGLAAVVSRVEATSSAPSVASLLAYERVVEAIHARQAVIPLRYGCVMESESAVIRLLEDHRQEYEALLGRLRGMTEMGIRVLGPARAAVLPDFPSSPGAAYLASLRKRYNSANSLAPEEAQLADQIMALLSGCSTEQRREISPPNLGRLVSLYFLTPKTDVERFRNKARQICPPGCTKMLLSGPWPPYNFVASLTDSVEWAP
ncbi:MAG TPA: GvpL/GvpF family gas vesicle protein [Terriglobia bacterium]|nr:GvpL/GvpF family gas vesicle protein [Terriglobia bacterium]